MSPTVDGGADISDASDAGGLQKRVFWWPVTGQIAAVVACLHGVACDYGVACVYGVAMVLLVSVVLVV